MLALFDSRLVEEVQEVLHSTHHVEYQDLGKLRYLSQVLKESLRMHPPIPNVSRLMTQDETLLGYHIPAGTALSLSPYVAHHSPALWEKPEEFIPERFNASNSEKIPINTYWPFSFGPRICIGQTFAQFEARVIVARLLQEYKMELLPGQDVLLYEERLTMRPKGGVFCTLTRKTWLLGHSLALSLDHTRMRNDESLYIFPIDNSKVAVESNGGLLRWFQF